jgi:hypothetical protein
MVMKEVIRKGETEKDGKYTIMHLQKKIDISWAMRAS